MRGETSAFCASVSSSGSGSRRSGSTKPEDLDVHCQSVHSLQLPLHPDYAAYVELLRGVNYTSHSKLRVHPVSVTSSSNQLMKTRAMDKGPGLGIAIGYDDVNKTGSSGTSSGSGSNRDKSSSSPSSSLLSAAVYQHTNPLYYRQVTNNPLLSCPLTLSLTLPIPSATVSVLHCLKCF